MRRPQWLNRRVWAWAFYDFGNSAFATTVWAVLFGPYFVKEIAGGGVRLGSWEISPVAFYAFLISFSMLATCVLAPLLGAWADAAGIRKKLLGCCWLAGSLATMLLGLLGPGQVGAACLLFGVASISFSAGNGLYHAFLSDLSCPETAGRVSGFGWAVGYIGGGLCLGVNLLMLARPQWFFLADKVQAVRASLSVAGLWWLIFGLPMFLELPEAAPSGAGPSSPFLRIGRSLAGIRSSPASASLWLFLLSYLIYNDGIETVIAMASTFGSQAIGMAEDSLAACFLMIQAVAFGGSLLFGFLADRLGHRRAIGLALLVYLLVCIVGSAIRTPWQFWALGAVIGLVLGGGQAASRSLARLLIPPEKTGELFGFFSLTGRLSSVPGPLLFGLMSQGWGIRAAVAGLSLWFVVGGLLLWKVRE